VHAVVQGDIVSIVLDGIDVEATAASLTLEVSALLELMHAVQCPARARDMNGVTSITLTDEHTLVGHFAARRIALCEHRARHVLLGVDLTYSA
jgi:hypothetical protein